MNAVTTNFKWCIYTTLLAMFLFFQTSYAQDGLTSAKYNIQNVRMNNDRLTISYDVYIQDVDSINLVALPGFLFRLAVPLNDLGTNAKTVTVTNASPQLGATAVYMTVRDSNWITQFTNAYFIASYYSALMPSAAFPGTLLGTFNISNTDGTQFANPQVINLNFGGTSPTNKSTVTIFEPYTTYLAPNSCVALPATSITGLQSYSLTAPVACPAPTGLSTSSITDSGVQINWTSNTSVQNYRVYWKVNIGDSAWQTSPLLPNTANSYSITSLTSNTQYSYFVASICADQSLNSSNRFIFTTDLALPSAPVLVSPANSSVSNPTNPTLAWNAATNATSYRVQVSTSSSFSPLLANEVVSSTSISLTDLAYSTAYYWRVCSINYTDSSVWSSVWSFSTFPPAPTLSSPWNYSVGIPTNPTLEWNAVANATSYRVQVSTSSSFSSLVKNEVVTSTDKSISGLANYTTYFWRVCSKTDTDSSAWSPVWFFTTIVEAPSVPTLALPANSAIAIALPPFLQWESASRATAYNLQVSTVNSFTSTVVNETEITSTSFSAYGLDNGTTYYWRVSANNAGGTSAWSPVWSFTTIPAAPAVPTLSLPANSATAIALSPSLQWGSVSGATRYYLQVSTVNTFTSTIKNETGLTSTSYLASGLAINTTYYWRVSATNIGGTSAWSPVWSFTTIPAAPAVPTLNSPANSATAIALSPSLQWGSVSGATTYNLQVSTVSTFATAAKNETGLTSTSYSASGLANGTTYYWRVSATNTGGTSAWSSVWSFSTNSGFALSGSLKYANSAQTPMNNCVIRLKNSNNAIIGTDTTDSQGYYSINTVPNGSYSIEILTTKQTGGISIADILMMRQAIAGSVTLSSIASKAADINANGSVNIQDVLPMRQKVANISPITTWLVPNYVFDPLQITINNANATLNIQALCGGDVNGSFVPTE